MPFKNDRSVFSYKFSMEGEEFVPDKYFAKFKDALFLGLPFTSVGEKSLEKSTDVALLDYDVAPKPIEYSFDVKNQEFVSLWNFVNGRATINDSLKSVERVLEDNCVDSERIIPKYENYQFLPIGQKDRVEEFSRRNYLSIVVKVYQPFFEKTTPMKEARLLQEINIIGPVMLAHLAGMIKCNIDFCGLDDISDKVPHGDVKFVANTAKQIYPSSFFFIGDTFYYDKKLIDSKDLSLELSSWLEKHKIGTFSHKSMAVPIETLPIKIGRPYVYLHQGLCEHIVIFSDAHLCKGVAPPSRVVAIGKFRCQKCMICRDLPANYLVKDFIKLTIDKALLCHRCLLSYCYIDKRKAGKFKVYKYTDIAAVL